MVTSNTKGHIAELKAQLRATELGYTISIPNHHCRYDLVLDDGHRLWRVQVKYANRFHLNSSGSVGVKLAYETRGRKIVYTYQSSEVDVLVVYIPKIDKLCWIPGSLFIGKKELLIRLDPPKNHQKEKITNASDYFW